MFIFYSRFEEFGRKSGLRESRFPTDGIFSYVGDERDLLSFEAAHELVDFTPFVSNGVKLHDVGR